MEKFLEEDGKIYFKGALGLALLTPQEVAAMLNGFNKTCEKLEEILALQANHLV